MSLIEVRNVFLMINFDVWDRLGHVWTFFDTVGFLGSIFHCHICEDFVSKWADLSVCKAFISKSLIKALQTLKSAHFDTKSSQICQWKIAFHNPTVSKMVRTCPNRSQTSKLIIRNTFWTPISDIRITLKKAAQSPPLKKEIPTTWRESVSKNFLESFEVKNFAKKWQNPEISKLHFGLEKKMDFPTFPSFCALSLRLIHRMITN